MCANNFTPLITFTIILEPITCMDSENTIYAVFMISICKFSGQIQNHPFLETQETMMSLEGRALGLWLMPMSPFLKLKKEERKGKGKGKEKKKEVLVVARCVPNDPSLEMTGNLAAFFLPFLEIHFINTILNANKQIAFYNRDD